MFGDPWEVQLIGVYVPMSLVLQPCCDHELTVETSFLLMAFSPPKVLITNCLCCRQSQLHFVVRQVFCSWHSVIRLTSILLFLLYSGFSYSVQLKCEKRKKVFNRTAEKEHQIPLFELSFTVSCLLFFRACLSTNPASFLFIVILFSHFHWGRKRTERNLL